MKNKIFCRAFFPLVLTGLLLVAFSGWAMARESKAGDSYRQDGVQITCEEKKYSGDNLEVNLKIPVITGMTDTGVQSALNALFGKSVSDEEKAITEQVEEYLEEATKSDFPLRTFQLYSDYKVTYNRNGLLSVTCEIYEYTGGAHGMTFRNSYNIDLDTGRELALKDLFKEGAGYKDIINREIERQIAADPDKYFMDVEWGFKTISDNQAFYIVDAEGSVSSVDYQDLVVYFGLYEIAPYASGIPEFKIPFTLIKDVKADGLPGPAGATSFNVDFDGLPVVFDVSPRLENGRFLVPLRPVLEAMGAEVTWYDETKTAVACLPGATLAVTAGSQYARINGCEYLMEVTAGIDNGRMIVPLDVLLEAAGVQSEWNSATRSLTLFGKAPSADFPAPVLDLQRDIQNQLDQMDRDLATAAGELALTGLDGDEACRILSGLASRYHYVVDCSTVDYNGKIVTVWPTTYHEFAGADISEQEQVMRLKETRRPVLSNVFMSVEGFAAVDMQWPVFNRPNELIGSVSLLIDQEQLFSSFAVPELQGQRLELMVMQKDGYILYDTDSSQIGRNTFTDPLYQDYTGLLALAQKVVADRAGVGTYASPDQSLQEQATQKSLWTTVGLYGTEWRLIVNQPRGR